MPGSHVVVEHVTRLRDGRATLADVSFELAPGELVALTGPSGSGKTTLLQLLGGLDRPTSGSIRVDEIAVHTLRHGAHYRRNVVGFVFQLHHLLPDLNVQDNVELTLVAAGVPRHERALRAHKLIGEVGLAGRERAMPAQLAGGERQRVAIARALAGDPRLLLADEPTGSLDAENSQRIWQLLLEVRAHHGTTILVASHDASLLTYADRGLTIASGKLLDPATAWAENAETAGLPEGFDDDLTGAR